MFNMFDKQTLLQRLKELSFPEKEYWIVAGSAMVLHGFRSQTHDIDLGCSTRLADELEQQGYAVTRCEDETRKILYSEDIEIFENWIEGKVELINGVPVVSVDGLIQMKTKLGRDKDLADIVLIEKVMTDYPNYMIIHFNGKYRDDMIFMVLEAQNALGRIPRLNEDLLDIPKNYMDTGDMFWLAIDENDRVIGCIGYNSILGTTEVKLHRLYVKAVRKHQGIGTRLLHTVERYLQEQGKTAVHVHLGGKDYFESHSFYPKHGYKEYAPSMMKKEL